MDQDGIKPYFEREVMDPKEFRLKHIPMKQWKILVAIGGYYVMLFIVDVALAIVAAGLAEPEEVGDDEEGGEEGGDDEDGRRLLSAAMPTNELDLPTDVKFNNGNKLYL